MKLYSILFFLTAFTALGCNSSSNTNDANVAKTTCITHKMQTAAKELQTFNADIKSIYLQPLLDASTTRTGRIYYLKDANNSALAIDFLTRKDDDANQIADRQKYIFDGVWLSRINYQTKHIEKRQIATLQEPQDALSLVSKNFPLIGFSDSQLLKSDFEIIELQMQNGLPCLELIPKQNTRFAADYSKLICLIDPNIYLPVKISAYAPQEDMYEITFSNIKINIDIEKDIFDPQTPQDFTIETILLEK